MLLCFSFQLLLLITCKKECFEQNKLTFVEDLIYGANYDANHPHRAYIAPVNVVVDGTYVPDYGTTEGLMDFKFKMRLPESVYGDLVLIQWYVRNLNALVFLLLSVVPKTHH
jgi:hypothetical protein